MIISVNSIKSYKNLESVAPTETKNQPLSSSTFSTVIIISIRDKKLQRVFSKRTNLNPFYATDLFLYPLKRSKNQRSSDGLRYRKTPVTWNGSSRNPNLSILWSLKASSSHCLLYRRNCKKKHYCI